MIVESNPLVLILKNTRRRVEFLVFDDSEAPVDAAGLQLQVQNMANVPVYDDDVSSPGTRIVNPEPGVYFITWGDPTAPANVPTQTETACEGKQLFVWTATDAAGVEEQTVQTVEVITARTADMIRELRTQIDKTRKAVSVDPTDFCPLGYTDAMLLQYLRGGMTLINSFQPYPTFCRLSDYPFERFGQTLVDAAMLVGLHAQELFAIDSDVENWSDQGNSFVINHQPKLAGFSQRTWARLESIVPKMKLHFVRSGAVKTEISGNYRMNVLLESAPSGALFRNVFLAGG